jgi:hypothetical protein
MWQTLKAAFNNFWNPTLELQDVIAPDVDLRRCF